MSTFSKMILLEINIIFTFSNKKSSKLRFVGIRQKITEQYLFEVA